MRDRAIILVPNIRGQLAVAQTAAFSLLSSAGQPVSGIGGFCVPNQFYNPCGFRAVAALGSLLG
jgi:hypothetical protein